MNRSNYEYKKSGVLWFGDIPDHWEIKKVKHIARFYTGWTPPSGNDEYYDGEYPWANISDLGTKYLETPVRKITQEAIDTLRMSISKKGSLLFSFKLSIGLVSMLSKDLFTNEAIATFPPNNRIETTYLYYLAPVAIPMNAGINIYNAPMLNQDSIKNAVLVYPPLDEQQAVASFLDRETARIDALIQKKERMIELLKEKRIALITQAVTKGLDPNVPMKDSGIEWLGEVPEHWDVKRLRYCIRLNPSKKEISHLPKDTEVSFLPMENVGEDGALDLSENRAISEVDSGYTYFGENDVAIAKITPCFENGKGCVFRNLEHGYGFGSTELTVMRPIDLVPEFLYYLTVSTYFRKIGEALMHGSAGQKRVPDDYIRNLYLGLPSIEEQQQIVCYVHEKLRSIEALNALTSLSIDKLREYRSSLIHHAVTGKIDLRGYDAQEQ